jgi:hypothetical protein
MTIYWRKLQMKFMEKLKKFITGEDLVEKVTEEKENRALLNGTPDLTEKEVEEINKTVDALITTPLKIEALLVDEEGVKEFDVDTNFRFEVYVGTDEGSVKLVNDKDFDSVERAKSFGIDYSTKHYPEQKTVVFVHEETFDENGNRVLNRHY